MFFWYEIPLKNAHLKKFVLFRESHSTAQHSGMEPVRCHSCTFNIGVGYELGIGTYFLPKRALGKKIKTGYIISTLHNLPGEALVAVFGLAGPWEWIIVLVVVMIFFGAGKMPQFWDRWDAVSSFQRWHEWRWNNPGMLTGVEPESLKETVTDVQGFKTVYQSSSSVTGTKAMCRLLNLV